MEMKIIRGIPPELYLELLQNDGMCQCGCGRKVDLTEFECSPAELADLPKEVLDAIRKLGAPVASVDPLFDNGGQQKDAAAHFAEKLAQTVEKVAGLAGAGEPMPCGEVNDKGQRVEYVKAPDRGNYMHLSTGGKYYPLSPRPEEVDIRDIAHSLATKARYAGHTIFPFWVAQHSCYTAVYNVPGFNRPEHRLARLLHDASEAYNGDLIRPLKYSPEFRAPFNVVEERNEKAIADRFGLPYPFEPHIKIADEAVTAAECEQLITRAPGEIFDNPLHDESRVAPFTFSEWNWDFAREAFSELFAVLVADRYINAPDAYFESPEYMRKFYDIVKHR